VTIVNTNYKEERNRRWKLEDEDRARKLEEKLEADKEELAKQTRHSIRDANNNLALHFEEVKQTLKDVKQEAVDRLAVIRQMHETTQSKIDENTEISKVAFKEANGVNEKLLGLGMSLSLAPKEVVVVNPEPIEVHNTNDSTSRGT
jgi:predicted phage tail protein